ncbi:MAG: hypothetical protein ABI939_09630 [Anaerolineaceae bacterium]
MISEGSLVDWLREHSNASVDRRDVLTKLVALAHVFYIVLGVGAGRLISKSPGDFPSTSNPNIDAFSVRPARRTPRLLSTETIVLSEVENRYQP